MQVKITRTTVAADGFVKVGQVIDLPEAEARMLIAIHKAVPVEAVQPAPEVLDTAEAAPVIDTDAPKAKRGRRAK
jgi:hypothetical protein